MNRQEAKRLLPIIQAFAEGKDIQERYGAGTCWADITTPDFGMNPANYRIKPESVKIRYRRYLWKDFGGKYLIDITTGDIKAVEDDAMFIKWIDPDWIEYEYTPE